MSQQFTGACIRRLAYSFGTRPDDFSRACRALNGSTLPSRADAAWELTILGSAKMRMLLYAPDEEFPPSAQFLFSANCADAFSAEDLAVAGDLVLNALKELAAKRQ